jgi:hypothetical protein
MQRDLPQPDRSRIGAKPVRSPILVNVEDLGGDQERLVGPSVADQAVLRAHASDPEKLSHFFRSIYIKVGKNLFGLRDPTISAQLPLSLDFDAIGLEPEKPSENLAAGLLGR